MGKRKPLLYKGKPLKRGFDKDFIKKNPYLRVDPKFTIPKKRLRRRKGVRKT